MDLIVYDMLFKITILIITGLLGLLIYFFKQFVISITKQFKDNSKEHSEILVTIAKMTAVIPDVDKCEEEVDSLKENVGKQGVMLDTHEKEIDKLWKRKK